jgi:sulfur relay (sulfurtransferase) DsrC/TusE family protein
MSLDDNRRKFWQRMLAYFVSPSILMVQAKQTVSQENNGVRIYHLFGNTPRQKAISKAWLMWNDEITAESS